MLRDELMAALRVMPDNVDVALAVGHYRVDITGIRYDKDRKEIVVDFMAEDLQEALVDVGPEFRAHIKDRQSIN
ncbi:hypothetical protein [Actinoplanes sp. ATCC 53533]|uniref:hypothetical protein n=1 Tax=Actinoplanes sp. ATCC 53533 TaxID=1288362 RepID=UPI000F79F1BD|nr:hypothetical protein [Actinoplanes sp. ATCC 53533]